jgi:predicted CoA-binding protein
MSEKGRSCDVPIHIPRDEDIEAILKDMRTIAVVGVSNDPDRPSYVVARYLHEHEFTVIPINPNLKELFGNKAYPDLGSVPSELLPIDVVDIFRRPDAVLDIVEQAVGIGARNIWMQEGIINNEAANRAIEAGLGLVMNKCIKKEHSERYASSRVIKR